MLYMFEFWLFVHVLMAILWVGGGIALNILGTRLLSANDTPALMSFSRQVEWIGTRVFMPASLLLLIAGIVMTLEIYDFETTWIIIGLAGFAYSFINGAFFVGPLSGRTGKLAEERGFDDSEVQGNVRRLFLLARIELVVLLIVVWAMAMKPGG